MLAAALACCVVTVAGCADFSVEPPTATVQPSLAPAEIHPQTEGPLATSVATPTSVDPSGPQTGPSSSGAEDPCRPSDPAIVAACLTTPWGLAVLPDGASAIVGERTTGRILQVVPQADPVVVAQIDGIDASGDGGLLGIALSPSYAEDGLIYAFVTTATDNRIVRIARGDVPKPVFTGIPKGSTHNGGRIEFGTDGFLYVATGDAGDSGAGADPGTLAGKVLRIDEFGKPAPADPSATATPTIAPTADTVPPDTNPGSASADPLTAVFADGLVAPTGLCAVTSGIAVVDRVGTADQLTVVTPGTDLSTAAPLWSFGTSDGGAVDCAQTESVLGATSLDLHLVTALSLAPSGGFTGQPQQLAKDTYGRLLTLEAGSQGLLWATTSNKDGHGDPQPRDDMVVIIPDGGGAGGGDGKD